MLRLTCFLGLIAVVSVAACGQGGHVTEKGTNQPLGGVVVVAARSGTVGTVVQGSTRCVHLAHALSDKEGRFSIPRGDAIYLAYKPGYHVVETNNEDRIVMEQHSESPAVRFEQILEPAGKIPYDCPEEELKRVIEAIMRPAYAELQPLVANRQQFEKADNVLGVVETYTLGDAAARANSLRRQAEWQHKGGAR
jgi:hypothetical protein